MGQGVRCLKEHQRIPLDGSNPGSPASSDVVGNPEHVAQIGRCFVQPERSSLEPATQ